MAERPTPAAAWLGQAALYALFATAIAVFSSWPTYRQLDPGRALIKVSFRQQGKPVADCRDATADELAKLPPNMRAPRVCPRERSPITVELDVDGAPVLHHVAPPAGLRRDGASAYYRRIDVPAGAHRLVVRIRDDVRNAGFDHVRETNVTLAPAQVLVIDFDPGKGGITVQ
jgi:hypothetical protein|nr:hypothetical protein [Caldimonas sp.]